MKKVYIAGSLFKDGDIKERKYEGKVLREKGLEVFNPIEAPFNEDKSKALPTAKDIFLGDTNEVLTSDYIFAEIDGEDPGVMAELGIAWAISHLHEYFESGKTIEDFKKEYPKKQLIAHSTDIRINSAGEYNKIYVPFGINQYVVGMIENQGKLHTTKTEAFNDIKK